MIVRSVCFSACTLYLSIGAWLETGLIATRGVLATSGGSSTSCRNMVDRAHERNRVAFD